MNESTNDNQPVYQRKAPWIAHLIVTILILIIAFAVVASMFMSKPEARKWGGRPAPSVAVEVSELAPTEYEVWVDSYGTAEALTRTNLVADVNGRVVEVSSKIRAGSSFKQGDVLVRLDDRDFKIQVEIAKAAVADAEVVYLREIAEAELAKKEWNVRPDSDAAQALALREPQVAAAQASLQAAKARLEQAELNLERTRVIAPFDGRVLRQSVDLGQVVSPAQTIAEIYSTDAVEVRLPIKANELTFLQIPDENTLNDRPRVVFEGEVGNRTYQWSGELIRSEGAFDRATRMLYVVARIDQPFTATEERPAIRIGQFLRAKVAGDRLTNVFVLPRRAVSQDYTVSIAQEGVLKKRKVEPLWTDVNSVVVAASNDLDMPQDGRMALPSSDISADDVLILTPTANLPGGTRIKPMGQENEQPKDSSRVAREGNKDGGPSAPSTNASR